MKKPSVKNKSSAKQPKRSDDRRLMTDSSFLKIGAAAKILGVSIDTLRRWEKAGKIASTRTPGETRLYSLSTLKKLNPASVEDFQAKSFSTEELLKRAGLASEDKTIETVIARTWQSSAEDPSLIAQDDRLRGFKQTLLTKFLIGSAVLSVITLLITSWITASYLTNPKETQQFFKNNVASGILSPFHLLAEETVAVISPEKAKELGFISSLQGVPLEPLEPTTTNVLAVTTSPKFLEVNSDTQINGSLSVRDNINGLTVEATPSASTLALISGDTTLTITNSSTIDQDLATAASPTFNTLNLSATKDQLVFQSGGLASPAGGPTGTLTWTPTAQRTITLPDATTTLVGIDTTQTLTNKSMSGSSNTFTNIPNSALSNSKVTVTAGTNLSGGGDINLGSSATISLKDSVSLSGTLGVTGATTLSSTLSVSGASTLSSTLAVTGATTLSSSLAVSGNVGIGYTGSTVIAPSLGLTVQGNVGIGTTSPNFKLDVNGIVNATSLYVNGSPYIGSQWTTSGNDIYYTTGNVGVGFTSPSAALTIGSSEQFRVSSTGNLIRINDVPYSFPSSQAAAANYVLANDASGNLSWQAVAGVGGVSGTGTAGGVTYWNGTSTVTDSIANFYWDSVNNRLGIGTSAPQYRLDVAGTGRFTGFVGIGSSLNVSGNVGIGQSLTVSSGTVLQGGLAVTGGSVVLPAGSIQNSELENSAITVTATAGTGLSVSGSPVSLGGTLTIAGIDASTTVKGVASFNSTNFSVSSGAVNTIQDIATSSSPTFSNLTLTGNLGVGGSLVVTGNVGIGKSLSVTDLGVFNKGITVSGLSNLTGNVGIGGSASVASFLSVGSLYSSGAVCLGTDCRTVWPVTVTGESTTASNGLTLNGYDVRLGGMLTQATGIDINSQNFGFLGNIGIGTSANSGARLSVMGGNVGIGTTSPLAGLHVVEDVLVNPKSSSSSTLEGTIYYDSDDDQLKVYANGKWQSDRTTATKIVATTNGAGATQNSEKADYVCGATDCDTTIETAITALPTGGGVVALLEGTYVIDSDGIDITKSNVSLIGVGKATILQRGWDTATNDGVITVGDGGTTAVSGVVIANLSIDGQKGTYAGTQNIGIYFNQKVSQSRIQNNWIYDNDGDGIHFYGNSASSIIDNFINGNMIKNNDGNGIYLESASNSGYIVKNIISNNLIANNNIGINLYYGSSYNIISANTIYDNSSYGIGFTSYLNYYGLALYNNVVGNEIFNNGGTEIYFQSAGGGTENKNNLISSNYIWDDAGTGIDIGDTETWDTYIIGNEITGVATKISDSGTGTTIQQRDQFEVEASGTTTALTVSQASTGDILNLLDGTTEVFTVLDGGNVGIGTTAPLSAFQIGSSLALAGKTLSFSTLTGNLGIGTTTPGATLSVAGNIGIGVSFANASVPSNGLAVSGNVGIGTTTANSNLSVVGNAHIGSLYQGIAAPTNGLFVDGNVGIGATTSDNKLDVWGGARITNGLTLDGLSSSAATALCINSSNQVVQCSGSSALTGTGVNGGVTYWNGSNTLSNSVANFYWDSTNNRLGIGTSSPGGSLVVQTGNVGIGISAPSALLQLSSTLSQDLFRVDDNGVGDVTPFLIDLNGNVGIGKTTPTSLLDIFAGNSGQVTITSDLSSAARSTDVLTINQANNATYNSTGNLLQLTNSDTGSTGALLDINQAANGVAITINTTLNSYDSAIKANTSNLVIDSADIANSGAVFEINTGYSSGFAAIEFPASARGSIPTQLLLIRHNDGNDVVANGINFSAGFSGGITNAINASNSNITNALNIGGNNILGSFSIWDGNGNVGIGTTAPTASLQVQGNVGIGYTSVAIPSNGLAVQGNVGVGTTSPLGALHVIGQCVTWDTRIRIRRRRRGFGDPREEDDDNTGRDDVIPADAGIQLTTSDSELDPALRRDDRTGKDDMVQYDYLEVMIKDILPGDEVLSLNENTQEFEYQRVEKLLDMGSKGVYELTTASGRTIKTTGNHPYLVSFFTNQDSHGRSRSLGMTKPLVHQSPIQDAGWVKVINLAVGDQIAVADSALFRSEQDQTGQEQNGNHQQSIGDINTGKKILSIHDNLLFSDRIRETIKPTIPNGKFPVNNLWYSPIEEVPNNPGEISTTPNQPEVKLMNMAVSTSRNVFPETSFILPTLSNQDLSVNHTSMTWDTIVSIKYLGYEHVYDLQIENTHNFLANDIVAHNTYINGNLGIGAYSGLTVPSNGLAVSGNVGIGTTTANSALSVNGGAAIGQLYSTGNAAPANGLIVQGNVGIGTSIPGYLVDVAAGNSKQLYITSDLSSGARSTDVLTITQANNATYNSTGNLLQLTNNDQYSTAAVLDISQAASSGTYINLGTIINSQTGLNAPINNTGTGISISTTLGISSGTGISISESVNGNPNDFSGDMIKINGSNTYTTASTLTESGNFLDLSRSHTVNNASGTYAISGDLATLSSNCTQTSGTCTDTSRILRLAQLYPNATGAVLGIDNAGSGASLAIMRGNVGIGTSVPGGALSIMGGNVGIGTTFPNATLSIQGSVGIGYTGASSVIPSNGLAVFGNVGIGTTTANSNLSVAGSAHIGGLYQGIAAPANGLFVDGNVGIGATTSNNKLDVWGNQRITGTLTVDQTTTLSSLGIGVVQSNSSGVLSSSALNLAGGSSYITGILPIANGGTNNSSFATGGAIFYDGTRLNQNTANFYWDNTNSRLGIGTSAPTAKLDIAGTTSTITNSSGNITITPAGNLIVDTGNVGIGTTIVDYKLKVSGTGYFSGFVGIGSSLNVSGNVGVGGSLTVTSGTVLQGGLAVTGGSVVLPAGSIQNSELENSFISVTATAGTGISVSGSPVSLGGTLTVAGIDASTTVKGVASFNSTNFSVSSGAVNTIQDIATTATPGFVGLNTTSGNVGIGTSATGSRLAVNGNGVIGWGTASVAGPTNGLAVFGNVGVGTTSPLGALHVVGQCVTGDTRLRRRRKNKKGEWEWDEVEIKDIEKGDEILTLDENTGKLTVSKVNKLLDKGIRDTYILRTSVGKKIRTTIEHPYFVRTAKTISSTFEADQSIRIEELGKTSFIALASLKTADRAILIINSEYKDKEYRFYKKAGRQNLFGPTIWARSILALTKHLNITNSVLLLDEEYPGYMEIISRIIETERPDLTVGFRNIGKNSPAHEAAYFAHKKMTGAQNLILVAEDVLHSEFTEIRTPSSHFTPQLYGRKFDLSRGSFRKVSEINPGMEVLTVDGWEKITALGKVGREQVFDIEVEGTHNFVGNDIVAHNTYINGNLGIGIASPASNFQLVGSGTGTGVQLLTQNSTQTNFGLSVLDNGNVGIGTTNPGSALTVIGNVGIGTSGAGTNLQINGGAAIGFGSAAVSSFANNGLIVNGNVGIGNSSPGAALDVTGSIQGSSQFLAPNGAIAAPSYAFTNNTNMGFYRYGSNIMGTAVNGQGGFFLDGTSGTGRVTVDYSVAAASKFHIQNDNNNTASGITLGTSSSTWMQLYKSGSNQLAIMGGNVGIGTSNPTATLQVQGNVGIGYTNVAIPSNGLAVFGNVGVGTTTSNSKLSVVGNAVISQNWGGISAPTSGLIVEGNMGIGFTTPDRSLQAASDIDITSTVASLLGAGGSQFSITGSTAANLQKKLTLGIDTTDNYGIIQAGNLDGTAYNLALNPGAGNVGIGTTSPTRGKLEISGVSADASIFVGGTTGTAGPSIHLKHEGTGGREYGIWSTGSGNSGGAGLFQIYDLATGNSVNFQGSSGNVGIGTASPVADLHLEGDATSTAVNFLSTGAAGGGGLVGILDNGNVGIGTTEPQQKLHINSAAATTALVQWTINGSYASYAGLAETTNAMFQGAVAGDFAIRGNTGNKLHLGVGDGSAGPAITISSGNVGIGTTGPATKLHVANTYTAPTGGIDANIWGLISNNDAVGNYAGLGILAGSSAASFIHFGDADDADVGKIDYWHSDNSMRFTVNTSEAVRINSSGYVGIGTTNPGARLTVIKDDNTTGSIASFYPANLSQGTRLTYRGLETISGAMFIDAFSNQNIVMQTQSTGNVGIGTTSPAAKFEVSSGTVAPWSRLNAGDSTFTVSSSKSVKENFNLVSGTDVLDKISTVPVYTFDFINGSKDVMGLLAEDFYTIFGRGDASAINYQEVMMANWLGTQQLYKEVVSQGHSLSTQGVTLNRLSGALSVSGGNVGIGTSNPTSALDVAGKITSGVGFDSPEVNTPLLDLGPATIASSAGNLAIQFSSDTTLFQIKNSLGQNLFQIDASGSAKLAGTITTEAGAFDVAEDYLAKDGVEAGDVVSLSPVILNASEGSLTNVSSTSVGDSSLITQNDNSGVAKSSKPYDNSIIGIISTNPGISLKSTSGVSSGSPEMEIRPVALNGRVPVKVSTENGAINVGDYLTSSSTPGVAMKATKPGTVIGKALEAFPTDTSEVKKCDYTSEVDCGKIVIFINISFADPGNFLASLSLDDQGNMIIPKIRTSSLLLDPSVASTSSQLTINDQRLTINSDPNYTSPGPNLATGSNQYIDLSGEIASLEERIAELENKLASQGDALEAQIAGEATSSASLNTTYDIPNTSSPSANLAQSTSEEPVPVTSEVLRSDSSEVEGLNLTPPDILLATGSATLANLTVTSEATVSGLLIAYQAQIQDNFKVLGQTTLADTLIAGELTVDGTLSLTGSSLSTLGPLYIQNSPLAQGIDIFNGKVTIDPGGNITTQGKIIATEIKTNKLTISDTPIATSSGVSSGSPEVGAASIGTATLPNGSSAVTIDSAEISDSAKVFITPTSPTDKILSVVNIKSRASFDVATLTPAQADIKFNWWIVQTN